MIKAKIEIKDTTPIVGMLFRSPDYEWVITKFDGSNVSYKGASQKFQDDTTVALDQFDKWILKKHIIYPYEKE